MGLLLNLVLLAICITVYMDARAIGVRKGLIPGFFNMGAGTWAWACFLFLLICGPLYLFKRGAYLRAAAREKEEAMSLAQVQSSIAEPGVWPPPPRASLPDDSTQA